MHPTSYINSNYKSFHLILSSYVVGCLLVLAREEGLRVEDSLSIIVSSEVPEGKGVSSSASVEVATMMAMVAAFGIQVWWLIFHDVQVSR